MKPYILATVSTGVPAIISLLYILIKCIKNLPALNGRRQQLINPLRGKARTIELLYGPPQALKTVTRLNQRMFKLLLNRLVNDYKLHTQEGIGGAEAGDVYGQMWGWKAERTPSTSWIAPLLWRPEEALTPCRLRPGEP
jgi:hypothetical protein